MPKYDLLKVIKLKDPNIDHLNWAVDETWKDFGGEKPVDDNGEQIYAYSTLQRFAREKLQSGELADWEGFLSVLPNTGLSQYLFMNRTETLEVRLAYSELLFAASQENFRTPQIMDLLWQHLLKTVSIAKMQFPTEAIAQWNLTTLEFSLPDNWRFTDA